MDQPFICGFIKLRNEIIREGNVYRVLRNISRICDCGVICDDNSFDGTREYLEAFVRENPTWRLIVVPASEQNFQHELHWKQRMLEEVHKIKPRWILWMDGDEVFDDSGTTHFRKWVETLKDRPEKAWAFHYTQFWRNTSWARTDGGFDDSRFIKLWRYNPELSFEVVNHTHHNQFPQQIDLSSVGQGPFEQLHYGNYGKNLIWKCIQYYGGLGGVDRHLVFPNASYRAVEQSIIPNDCEKYEQPSVKPFTDSEVAYIRDMKNLCKLPGWFAVVVPAYNRSDTLPRALDSLIAQTYCRWIAIVLDDGSTDDTAQIMRVYQDRDPRIFYARYPINRGGVAMNEIGMTMACEMTEYWSRLGSDDWFAPRKLELDVCALVSNEAVFGPFQACRDGQLAEICSPPQSAIQVRQRMVDNLAFDASWANCAVRTSLLQRVRDKYGNFCDPSIRNMEDYLFNVRAARESKGWVWRGLIGNKLVIDPQSSDVGTVTPDGFWNINPVGASSNTDQTRRDEEITLQCLRNEAAGLIIQASPQPESKAMTTIVSDEMRKSWRLATTFPPDKEAVYPEHRVVQEFDEHSNKHVLDYGCGGGPDTISYLKRYNEVWYADIVPENIEIATKRIQAQGLKANAHHPVLLEFSAPLPLPDEHFDIVSSHGVVHHIPTPDPVVQEFHRISKPDGLCYLMLYTEMLWSKSLPEMAIRMRAGKCADFFAAFSDITDPGTPYARSYTDAEGRELLEKAGFVVEKSTVWNNGDFRTFKARKPVSA